MAFRLRSAAAFACLLACVSWISPAGAQAGDAQCEALARLPNPPMTVAACKSLLAMGRATDLAAAAPSASRPGDDALTCGQIFAEMAGASASFAETPEAAKTQASLDAYLALRKKHEAENLALQAQGNAAIMASAAADMATGGLSKGAATNAVAMGIEAEALAQAQRQQAEDRPALADMGAAIDASALQDAAMMQANPRAARLGQLAVERNCQPPGS
jgi:hypothetical protein